MSTIPANKIVQVTPSVLAAGGRALDLIAVMLTNGNRVPMGAVQPFSNADDVGTYFGSASTEKSLAEVYFQGFDNSNIKPQRVYFAQYNEDDVPAWLRTGKVSTLTLAQLQAIAVGALTITINGTAQTGAAIDLSAATSFSSAASIIEAAFVAGVQTQATCDSGTISGTTMTVAGSITGEFKAGDTITGTSVTADSIILQQLTSSEVGGVLGGAGTYELSQSSTVAVGETLTSSDTPPLVTYDSTAGAFLFTVQLDGAASTIGFGSGTLSSSIFATEATGAVTSQGADAADASTFMDGIKSITQNWATFMTTFDPDASGHDNKLAFAQWVATENNRWGYVCWDTDTAPTTTVPATTSFGYALQQGGYSGICPIFAPDATKAAFVCGAAASIDFTEHEGRITFAFKRQSGLVADVTDQTSADNLEENGYNYFGVFATANDEFRWFYPGSVSGDFLWFDSYVNQIWMNNSFQLQLMVLLDNRKSIPYNRQGYSLIEAAMLDTINTAVDVGVIRAGVTLSEAQKAEVNNDAGIAIDKVLNERGWYTQVRDATPEVRAARGSPPVTFWYMDGQSIQKINLASIELV